MCNNGAVPQPHNDMNNQHEVNEEPFQFKIFDVVELVNRDVLVTRRALNMQPKVEDDEEQRGHIFHTKDVI